MNKKEQIEYFAYFGGKLLDHNGNICPNYIRGVTAYSRRSAIEILRRTKKRSGRKYWGRLDFIVQFGEIKKTIFPNDF